MLTDVITVNFDGVQPYNDPSEETGTADGIYHLPALKQGSTFSHIFALTDASNGNAPLNAALFTPRAEFRSAHGAALQVAATFLRTGGPGEWMMRVEASDMASMTSSGVWDMELVYTEDLSAYTTADNVPASDNVTHVDRKISGVYSFTREATTGIL